MPDGVTGNPAKRDFTSPEGEVQHATLFIVLLKLITMPDGVTGNTLDSGSRESRFDP